MGAQETREGAVAGGELGPRTGLDEPAAFEHVNDIGVPDRGEPVRDDDGRHWPGELITGIEDQLFVDRIERARGFVQHQEVRVRQQRTRKRETLTLTAR